MNQDLAWQVFRYSLLIVGGYFVKQGLVTDAQVTAVIAAIGTLFVFVWGLAVKWRTRSVVAQVAENAGIATVHPATGKVVM